MDAAPAKVYYSRKWNPNWTSIFSMQCFWTSHNQLFHHTAILSLCERPQDPGFVCITGTSISVTQVYSLQAEAEIILTSSFRLFSQTLVPPTPQKTFNILFLAYLQWSYCCNINILLLFFSRDINPHIPQYISSVPWYIDPSKRPTLKHQRPQDEIEAQFSTIGEWYKRGVQEVRVNQWVTFM